MKRKPDFLIFLLNTASKEWAFKIADEFSITWPSFITNLVDLNQYSVKTAPRAKNFKEFNWKAAEWKTEVRKIMGQTMVALGFLAQEVSFFEFDDGDSIEEKAFCFCLDFLFFWNINRRSYQINIFLKRRMCKILSISRKVSIGRYLSYIVKCG